jgi:prevent-host-death family protein
MTKTITLCEASQSLDRCIREVEAGEKFVITQDSTPVARLLPPKRERELTPDQQAAWERISRRIEEG